MARRDAGRYPHTELPYNEHVLGARTLHRSHWSKRHGQFETHSPSHEVRSQTGSREINEARERAEHAQDIRTSRRERASDRQGREEGRTSEGRCTDEGCRARESRCSGESSSSSESRCSGESRGSGESGCATKGSCSSESGSGSGTRTTAGGRANTRTSRRC